MQNITLNVAGMTCGHCKMAIEGSVGAMDGISQATVNLGEGTVQVEYDPSLADLDAIKETIVELGYQVG